MASSTNYLLVKNAAEAMAALLKEMYDEVGRPVVIIGIVGHDRTMRGMTEVLQDEMAEEMMRLVHERFASSMKPYSKPDDN
jgi:nitrogenase molybdenum-iron protein alpha/beta subunit